MAKDELNILVLLRETCDPRPPVRLTADGFGVRERGLRRIANPSDLAGPSLVVGGGAGLVATFMAARRVGT